MPRTIPILVITICFVSLVSGDSTRCESSESNIPDGQSAEIRFLRDKHAPDLTITQYSWKDDGHSTGEELLFIRNISNVQDFPKKRLVAPYDDIYYFVMGNKIVLLITNFKPKHVGRYVGTVAKESNPTSCGVNISLALPKSECHLNGGKQINCSFSNIPKKHTGRSFLVKSSSGEEFVYCNCERNETVSRCQSSAPGSRWQAFPAVLDDSDVFSAAFEMENAPTAGSNFFCELTSCPMPVEHTMCVNKETDVDKRNPTVQILAAIALVLLISTVVCAIVPAVRLVYPACSNNQRNRRDSKQRNKQLGFFVVVSVLFFLQFSVIIAIIVIS